MSLYNRKFNRNNAKIFLNEEQVEHLIELYNNESDLWNVVSPNYFKKEERKNALERIKEEMEEQYGVVCSGIFMIEY